MHACYFKNRKSPVFVQPPTSSYRPEKRDHAWEIVDTETGLVVDKYTPPAPKKRDQPITPYEGSWAHSTAMEREK